MTWHLMIWWQFVYIYPSLLPYIYHLSLPSNLCNSWCCVAHCPSLGTNVHMKMTNMTRLITRLPRHLFSLSTTTSDVFINLDPVFVEALLKWMKETEWRRVQLKSQKLRSRTFILKYLTYLHHSQKCNTDIQLLLRDLPSWCSARWLLGLKRNWSEINSCR